MGRLIAEMPSRRRLVLLCILYGIMMLYSSTVVGPLGLNFVYRDPADVFRDFLHTPYVIHGSDQRADWVGNLLMLVPFGFLACGAFWPRRLMLWPLAAIATLAVCLGSILGIKYLQLFFPPRTVTLNYIMAQSAGALIGCVAFAAWRVRSPAAAGRRDMVGLFVWLLRLYAAALFLFVLMPLDFALDGDDLAAQLARLPDTVLALPGAGRPVQVRAVLIVMAAAAFVPVGMLLSFTGRGFYRVGRGLAGVVGLGFLLTTAFYAAATLVMGAYPTVPSIFYRTLGIAVGALGLRWIARTDPVALQRLCRRAVPWLTALYLLMVLVVNRLWSIHWQTPAQALAGLYWLGLLPLFDFYIVTKAEAAKNLVGHIVLYMPVGVLLWLRYGKPLCGRAFVLGAALSLIVEAGRYLRPGLEGDVNDVVVGAVAAAVAAGLMPSVWDMVLALHRGPNRSVAPWNRQASLPGSTADIENY